MLGHASVSITLDLYSHVLPDMQDAAVRAMEHTLQQAPLSSELSSNQNEGERDGGNEEA